jgi:hypothetical protein
VTGRSHRFHLDHTRLRTAGMPQPSYPTTSAGRYTQVSPWFLFHFTTATPPLVRGLRGRFVPTNLPKSLAFFRIANAK